MTRVIGVLVHNWPLKIAAIGLATLLYGGLVLSQSSATLTGVVPVVPRDQPPDTFLLQTIRPVTEIRYFTPSNVRPIESDFEAWVDLGGINPGDGAQSVPVQLRSIDPRVRVLGFEPQSVTVDLDRLSEKVVPVQIDHGEAPSGLTLGPESADPAEVRVVGPASVLERVAAARASVIFQTSGIDVDQDVELVAVDSVGDAVAQVNVDPATSRIKVQIVSNEQTKTLPVSPQVTGSPAAGFEFGPATVEPAVVTVQGDADELQTLVSVDTQPIPAGGVSSDRTVTIGLALPNGVIALDAQDVTVTITVRPVTATRSFEVGVRAIGVRAEYEYQIGVDRLLLTVGGSPTDLDRIVGATLAADLDVSALGPGTTDVRVGATLPTGISLVAASPDEVAVTVMPRSTPPPG
ncbi:MAG TPA: CdaR family protein [Candidatus Limnocylindrales bacterium]|nr:CdaR family protein [Candidatus Limnocylindrales bacterium]